MVIAPLRQCREVLKTLLCSSRYIYESVLRRSPDLLVDGQKVTSFILLWLSHLYVHTCRVGQKVHVV